jgi:putative NADH-flavin reductase
MRLIVFGASGRTGLYLVQQALDAGHEVRAFVRTPAKMTLRHDGLTMVQGDVYDADKVASAVQGTDAVLSVLGYTKESPKNMQTVAAKNIVNAMQKHQVRRIVSLSSPAVSDPEDEPKLFNRLIMGFFALLSRDRLDETRTAAEIIRQSGLDWVIVRVPVLSDGPHTGKYRVGYVGKGVGGRLSRADAADFLLKQVSDNTYLCKAPMISK